MTSAKPATQRVDWWLAEVGMYGYAHKLVDGPHSDRDGVEQAAYLIRGLGLQGKREFCCLRVEQTPVEPIAHDVNHEALAACQMMIARSK